MMLANNASRGAVCLHEPQLYAWLSTVANVSEGQHFVQAQQLCNLDARASDGWSVALDGGKGVCESY